MIKFAGSRQQGVALIMVLLAMALVVLMASGMTRQQSLRVFKAGHYLAQQQGQSIALGAEEFAKRILVRDYEEDKENSVMVDVPCLMPGIDATSRPLGEVVFNCWETIKKYGPDGWFVIEEILNVMSKN